jgi:hypothetical protein
MTDDDVTLAQLRAAIRAMHESIEDLHRDRDKPWPAPPTIEPMVVDRTGWNFSTYSIHINQRFSDLSLQLQQRFEAQQTSVSTAMVAAEKAVNAALTAAEKAVDKAEQAQALRNEAQNEFRKSLSDLSGLMWTTKEGTSALDALRREFDIRNNSNEEKVNELSTTFANIQGRFWVIGIAWGAIVVIASTVIHWFK